MLSEEPEIKLLTLVHGGKAGQRGGEATAATLCEQFSCSGQQSDANDFLSDCLYCIMCRSGLRVPPGLESTLHASLPGEVLHFDYHNLGGSTYETKSALVLKDDFRGYSWLSASPSAIAEHAEQVLACWQRTFTALQHWVSEQGPHFINERLRDIADLHNIHHCATVDYSPPENGTVESLNRDMLTAMRSMLVGLKLVPKD